MLCEGNSTESWDWLGGCVGGRCLNSECVCQPGWDHDDSLGRSFDCGKPTNAVRYWGVVLLLITFAVCVLLAKAIHKEVQGFRKMAHMKGQRIKTKKRKWTRIKRLFWTLLYNAAEVPFLLLLVVFDGSITIASFPVIILAITSSVLALWEFILSLMEGVDRIETEFKLNHAKFKRDLKRVSIFTMPPVALAMAIGSAPGMLSTKTFNQLVACFLLWMTFLVFFGTWHMNRATTAAMKILESMSDLETRIGSNINQVRPEQQLNLLRRFRAVNLYLLFPSSNCTLVLQAICLLCLEKLPFQFLIICSLIAYLHASNTAVAYVMLFQRGTKETKSKQQQANQVAVQPTESEFSDLETVSVSAKSTEDIPRPMRELTALSILSKSWRGAEFEDFIEQ